MSEIAPNRCPPEAPFGIRRVQVGVGPKNAHPDWWNTDIRHFDGIDEVMDATLPWKWDGILDFVYAEHFLEHLDIAMGAQFLVNAGNALHPGGVLRLSTPSLEWVLSTHFSFTSAESPDQITETLAINRAFHGWGHKFLYSRGLLNWLLRSVGFSQISFHEYGGSDHPQLKNMEAHGGWRTDFEYPSVWIVEAVRPNDRLELRPETHARFHRDFLQHVQSGH